MARVAEVLIGKMKRWTRCRPDGWELKFRQKVLIEGDRCIEVGEVLRPYLEVPEDEAKTYPRILRLSLPQDFFRMKRFELKAKEVLRVCQQEVENLQLPMKLIDAEFTLDGAKLYIFFFSDERVDFRELVRHLASVYSRRIEMVQVTPREVTRITGGMGCCGKTLCCTSCRQFPQVTIQMAEKQFFPPGSSKIFGICGQIKCCMRYEFEVYQMQGERMPPMGAKVFTLSGEEGMVVGVDVYAEKAVVKTSEGKVMELNFSEICGSPCFRGGTDSDGNL
ncbi:MAG: stage 0 sporulation family protein [bacterium]